VKFKRKQHLNSMSSLGEIQQAIENLSLAERAELAKWFNGWQDDEWDRQMAADFASGGRLEHLKGKVQKSIIAGSLPDLP
jgi:hypothetical protein